MAAGGRMEPRRVRRARTSPRVSAVAARECRCARSFRVKVTETRSHAHTHPHTHTHARCADAAGRGKAVSESVAT